MLSQYRPTTITKLCAVVGIFLAIALSAEEAAPKEPLEVENVSIVVSGRPFSGSIIQPVTEDSFTFRLNGTKNVLTLKWSVLAEGERLRTRRIFGLEKPEPEAPAWGLDVECTRLILNTGRTVVGLHQPERDRPGFRCIKTADKQLMIPIPDIASSEKVILKESEIFQPEEAYERLLVRRPPSNDSAADHLETARACMDMGLYDKALDHFELAKAIDPRTEEQLRPFLAEVQAKRKVQLADRHFEAITEAYHKKDYATALARCESFADSYPDDARLTRVEKMRSELGPLKRAALQRMVVLKYYPFLRDALLKRMSQKIKVDERGRPVPAVPGKRITTLSGKKYSGILVSHDPEKIVLKRVSDDEAFDVKLADVKTINDVDLSIGVKLIDPSFEELKAYATDAEAVGADITARIAETLSIPEAEVQELWEGRFERVEVVEHGVARKLRAPAIRHKASYGIGSWLRDGAGSAKRPGSRTRSTDPRTSDDPEVWWRAQTSEGKLLILTALAAEALFQVEEIKGKPCPECGGRGQVSVFNAKPQRCPSCRGLKKLFTVVYE